jgi:polar amino acid transport system substrate-binding protein
MAGALVVSCPFHRETEARAGAGLPSKAAALVQAIRSAEVRPMNRCRFLLCVLCTLGARAAVAADEPDTLHLVTEDSPPYDMMVDGRVAGMSADKVVEVMKRVHQGFTLALLPRARAYQMAHSDASTCVFSTTRTPQREALFQWVGPIAYNTWMFYGLAERHYHLAQLDDARALRIGTYNADARDTFLRSKGFEVDAVSSDELNPRKLLAGRIDLWATGPYEARTLLANQGWTGRIVPVLAFQRVELYLACNPQVPGTVVERLDKALAAMRKDGTAAAIDRRYERWPAP